MAWQRLPLTFELQSPLHIGFLPNQPGTVVARTRCYVPGKNLWGAVVASLTPRLFPSLSPGAFHKIGRVIRSAIVFSYFYPCNSVRILTPDYGQDGLAWGGVPDREFRARYTGAYVSTRIGEAGGAADGSLHEIEFLRDRISSSPGDIQRVLLGGVIWVQEGTVVEGKQLQIKDASIFVDSYDLLHELTLGGERNYGFGLVRHIPVTEALKAEIDKLWPVETIPMEAYPLDSWASLSHLPYRPNYLFKGDVEIVAGREYTGQDNAPAFRRAGAHTENQGYWFVPGTRLISSSNQNIPLVGLDSWGRRVWLDP